MGCASSIGESVLKIALCVVQQFYSPEAFSRFCNTLVDKEFDLIVFPEACFESGEYGKWNAEEHVKFIENASK